MAKNTFLEGIRKGMLSYVQAKQWRSQQEAMQQQEMSRAQAAEFQKMQMKEYERQAKERKTPEQIAAERRDYYKQNPPAVEEKDRVWYDYEGNPHVQKYEMPPEEKRAFDLETQRMILEMKGKYDKGTVSKQYQAKPEQAVKMANDLISKMIPTDDKDATAPEAQPYYRKVVDLIMSGPDGYTKAAGYLRFQKLYDTDEYPELDDPALSTTPIELPIENGKTIQVDPFLYIETVAQEGGTDADIISAINFVRDYYGQRGIFQGTYRRYIQGPKQAPIEKFAQRMEGAQNIRWRR